MSEFREVGCNRSNLEIALNDGKPHGWILVAERKCPEGHVRREGRGRSGVSGCHKGSRCRCLHAHSERYEGSRAESQTRALK